MVASCVEVLRLCEWALNYDVFSEDDAVPGGCIIRSGWSAMYLVEVGTELVLRCVARRVLQAAAEFCPVSMVSCCAR